MSFLTSVNRSCVPSGVDGGRSLAPDSRRPEPDGAASSRWIWRPWRVDVDPASLWSARIQWPRIPPASRPRIALEGT